MKWTPTQRSLYAYLTDWCDYRHSEAVRAVEEARAKERKAA